MRFPTRLFISASGMVAVACLVDFWRTGDILRGGSASGGAVVVMLLTIIIIGVSSLARMIAGLVRRGRP